MFTTKNDMIYDLGQYESITGYWNLNKYRSTLAAGQSDSKMFSTIIPGLILSSPDPVSSLGPNHHKHLCVWILKKL